MFVERVLKNIMIFMTTLMLAMVGVLVWFTYYQAESLIHPDSYSSGQTPQDVGLTTVETVTFNTSDGVDLVAWYVPPPNSNGAVIIYLHGIAGTRDQMLGEAKLFYDRGYGAVLIDLRNHGQSGGDITTMGINEVEDVRATVDFLLTRPEVNAERIALFGNSLGGATAILAAAALPTIRAVVALSPYSSFLDVVGDQATMNYRIPRRPAADLVLFWGGQMSGENLYNAAPLAVIQSIAPRPILMIHGKLDRTTSYLSSERLKAATGDNVDLWIVEHAGHGGFASVEGDEYTQRITTFMDMHIGG